MALDLILFLLQQLQNAVGVVVNGVSNIIDNKFPGIGAAIDDARNSIYQWLIDRRNDVVSALGNATLGIEGFVGSGLNNLGTLVRGIGSSIQTNLTNGLTTLGNLVGSNAASVIQNLQNAANQLNQVLSNTGSTILGNLQNGVNSLTGLLDQADKNLAGLIKTGVGDLSQTLATIETQIGGTFGGLLDPLTKIVDALTLIADPTRPVKAILDMIAEQTQTPRNETNDLFNKKLSVIIRASRGEYTSFEKLVDDLSDPAPIVGLLAGAVFILAIAPAVGSIVGAVVSVLAIPLQQQILSRTLPTALAPEFLAQALVQNQIADGEAISEAGLSGISPHRFDIMRNVAGEPIAVMQALDLWNRGLVDEAFVNQVIAESRLKNKYTDPIKKLRFQIPPLADLIRFSVRESFRDDIAAKFGYDAEYPRELEKWLSFLGVDPDWLKRYWRAHWELPPFAQVAEMLHRSPETGVTLDDVEALLRTADVPEFWRRKLIAIAYNVFTRVDIRRMFKTKVLDRDGVRRAYLDLGYDERRAEALTEFTVKLEDSTGELDPDALERKHYTQLVALFVEGKRGESDLRSAMQSFGWGETAIISELETAKLRRESREKIEKPASIGISLESLHREQVNELESMYARGQADLSQLESSMRRFGWTNEQVVAELEIANLKKLSHYKPSAFATVREASASVILDAMILHTLTESDALSKLQTMGYSETSAALLVTTEKYKAASSIRKQIVAALKDAFIRTEIDEATVTATLLRYRFSADEITSFVELWTIEQALRHRRFSEAQLNTFLRRGAITLEIYERELRRDGYDDEQITWWLKLRGAL